MVFHGRDGPYFLELHNLFILIAIFLLLSEPNSPHRLVGRILIFSGKTGEVLRWVKTPDERETYFSPVIYTKKDGIELVLFGTGGETHPGGLWVVPLLDLFQGLIEKSKQIYNDEFKGKSTTHCHLKGFVEKSHK